jgi:ribosomal protein S18 acetylase RimI-like enzyme
VPVEIRRVRESDWPDLRTLRLEALADTPLAYLETLEQAQRMDDDAWRARAARGAEGGDSFQVMAWDEVRPVATSVAFLDDRGAWLAAVYVAPGHRGQGLLAELSERCLAWCRERGAAVLRLEVHEDNLRARTAYERLGFVDTGKRRPYPLDPTSDELLMERPL